MRLSSAEILLRTFFRRGRRVELALSTAEAGLLQPKCGTHSFYLFLAVSRYLEVVKPASISIDITTQSIPD